MGDHEADLPQTREVDEEVEAETSQDTIHAPKGAPGVTNFSWSPSYTESMLDEVRLR